MTAWRIVAALLWIAAMLFLLLWASQRSRAAAWERRWYDEERRKLQVYRSLGFWQERTSQLLQRLEDAGLLTDEEKLARHGGIGVDRGVAGGIRGRRRGRGFATDSDG